MRSIASLTLWLFVIGTSLILGAGLYEALVVVPFWSAGAPASLAEGNPLLQVHVRAGHVFWQYFTPVLGLITLLAMLTSFGTPSRHLTWRLSATGLMLRSRPWSIFVRSSSECLLTTEQGSQRKRWQQKHAAGWRSTGCGTSPSQLRWRWESERCFCPSGSGEGRFEARGSYKFAALIEFGSVMLGRLDPSNCLMPKSQLLRTGQGAHRADSVASEFRFGCRQPGSYNFGNTSP